MAKKPKAKKVGTNTVYPKKAGRLAYLSFPAMASFMSINLPTIEQKKTADSGVFKLDARGRPEGIIKLAADKSLSTRPGIFTPCRRDDLQEMIAEIAREVAKCLTPLSDDDRKRNRLKEQLADFEGGLSSYLNEWGLKDNEELALHRDKFVNKAKKIIQKSLTAPTKILRKIDTKPTRRRDELIFRMHRVFSGCLNKSGAPYRVTDCNHYIAHILKACEVESGDTVTVFKRIKQAHIRYLKANPGLKSVPQIF